MPAEFARRRQCYLNARPYSQGRQGRPKAPSIANRRIWEKAQDRYHPNPIRRRSRTLVRAVEAPVRHADPRQRVESWS